MCARNYNGGRYKGQSDLQRITRKVIADIEGDSMEPMLSAEAEEKRLRRMQSMRNIYMRNKVFHCLEACLLEVK